MGPNAYVSPNACVIDLPHDYGISSSFNIEDLVAYKSPTIISESAKAFAWHIHDLHNEICKKIQVSNSQYKIHADTRWRHAEFQVGDYAMIRIWPEQFPSGTVKKL